MVIKIVTKVRGHTFVVFMSGHMLHCASGLDRLDRIGSVPEDLRPPLTITLTITLLQEKIIWKRLYGKVAVSHSSIIMHAKSVSNALSDRRGWA